LPLLSTASGVDVGTIATIVLAVIGSVGAILMVVIGWRVTKNAPDSTETPYVTHLRQQILDLERTLTEKDTHIRELNRELREAEREPPVRSDYEHGG
tara:strand:- start:815 stop:1105 length:291 start_codon:yes stop_codon:yes gene_type:complete